MASINYQLLLLLCGNQKVDESNCTFLLSSFVRSLSVDDDDNGNDMECFVFFCLIKIVVDGVLFSFSFNFENIRKMS